MITEGDIQRQVDGTMSPSSRPGDRRINPARTESVTAIIDGVHFTMNPNEEPYPQFRCTYAPADVYGPDIRNAEVLLSSWYQFGRRLGLSTLRRFSVIPCVRCAVMESAVQESISGLESLATGLIEVRDAKND
jgi:hypothetical protein